MALDRPVHGRGTVSRTTAPVVAAPLALGAAVLGGLAQMSPRLGSKS